MSRMNVVEDAFFTATCDANQIKQKHFNKTSVLGNKYLKRKNA